MSCYDPGGVTVLFADLRARMVAIERLGGLDDASTAGRAALVRLAERARSMDVRRAAKRALARLDRAPR